MGFDGEWHPGKQQSLLYLYTYEFKINDPSAGKIFQQRNRQEIDKIVLFNLPASTQLYIAIQVTNTIQPKTCCMLKTNSA
jgi:hypothetical protein